ncbi:MAG: response regulator transcription factor [Marivibrio sp.]|uniref:response regulator transcription factor n=1 Tax=Marivibrio sp. TaxID=2039719 RepID=UPI0032EC228F
MPDAPALPPFGGLTEPRVLIVDDHSSVRMGLNSCVRELWVRASVTECGSFQGALEALERVPYDLVILDLMMPNGSPEEMQRVVRGAAGAKVLVMSMVEDAEVIKRTLALGVAGFLPKSASLAATRLALAMVMDGETYVPAQILSGGREAYERTARHAPSPVAGGRADRAGLTAMQMRVLREMNTGASNQMIANALDLALPTVKAHVAAVMQKLKAKNRTQAVLIAQEAGLLQLEVPGVSTQ